MKLTRCFFFPDSIMVRSFGSSSVSRLRALVEHQLAGIQRLLFRILLQSTTGRYRRSLTFKVISLKFIC